MPMATAMAERDMGLKFEVGDSVIEVMGSGDGAKKFRTKVVRLLNNRVCVIEGGREYDRLTGAAVAGLPRLPGHPHSREVQARERGGGGDVSKTFSIPSADLLTPSLEAYNGMMLSGPEPATAPMTLGELSALAKQFERLPCKVRVTQGVMEMLQRSAGFPPPVTVTCTFRGMPIVADLPDDHEPGYEFVYASPQPMAWLIAPHMMHRSGL